MRFKVPLGKDTYNIIMSKNPTLEMHYYDANTIDLRSPTHRVTFENRGKTIIAGEIRQGSLFRLDKAIFLEGI
jgi:hypothetical protein